MTSLPSCGGDAAHTLAVTGEAPLVQGVRAALDSLFGVPHA